MSFDENFKVNDDEDEILNFNKQTVLEQVIENNDEIVDNLTHSNDNILKSTPWILKNHPIDNIIGDVNTRFLTRRQLNEMSHIAFISNIEPKNYKEATKE